MYRPKREDCASDIELFEFAQSDQPRDTSVSLILPKGRTTFASGSPSVFSVSIVPSSKSKVPHVPIEGNIISFMLEVDSELAPTRMP